MSDGLPEPAPAAPVAPVADSVGDGASQPAGLAGASQLDSAPEALNPDGSPSDGQGLSLGHLARL